MRRFISRPPPPLRIAAPPGWQRPFSAAAAAAQGIRQPPDADAVNFPGAVQSKFTSSLTFHRPQDTPAMPTYRYLNAEGVVVDTARTLDIGRDKARKMYRDMVVTSVMDLIMCVYSFSFSSSPFFLSTLQLASTETTRALIRADEGGGGGGGGW